MAPSPPTRREILILILLLISLVSLSNLNKPSKTPLFSHPSLEAVINNWQSSPADPETTVVAHVPGHYPSSYTSPSHLHTTGWTILDNLYIFKGVVYIVTDNSSTIPDLNFIYSKGIYILPGRENELSRLPTDENIRLISSSQAKELFGSGIQTIDGMTVRPDPSIHLTNAKMFPVPASCK